MTVEVGEVRLVTALVGCFITTTAVIAGEPLSHSLLAKALALVFMIAALATFIEAGHPKNDD